MAARPKCKCRDGRECRPCYLLRTDPRYLKLWDGPAVGRTPPPVGSPGTELTALLASIGLTGADGCGCKQLARLMDHWGADGCDEPANRERILVWLRRKAGEQSWGTYLRAAALALTRGIGFSLNPADPAPGLLNEAIRRARASHRGPS